MVLFGAIAGIHREKRQESLIGAVAMPPVVLIFESPFSPSRRWQELAAVAASGVFGTGLAYLLLFRVFALAGATRTTLITYVTPMAAIMLGGAVPRRTADPTGLRGHGADSARYDCRRGATKRKTLNTVS
jgi:hypothetical protein